MSVACTIEERVTMMRLFSKFENTHEVHRQWNQHFDTTPPHETTVLLINRIFNESGSVEDLPRESHPSTVLSEEKMVISSPQLSIRQGAAAVGISKSSYQVAMKHLHFKPYRPTLVVELNGDDFDRRSEFCETWLEKFENDSDLIDLIFWSDEDKFSVDTTVNQHNCTYWSRENPHIRLEVPNMQERVTVWCRMTSHGFDSM